MQSRGSTPTISVFTPSHDPRFLDDCYASLKAQSFEAWEWVVVLQGHGWTEPNDPRVRVLRRDQLRGVGAAKSYAVEHCEGELLVELDHDDVLASDALAQLWAWHLARPDCGFFYSDTAQVQVDLTKDPTRFRADCGWEYRDVKVDGRDVLACTALEPSPHNVSFIWWAPNHMRAFTREAYDAAGGYDPSREVCDDADLMCRLFEVTDFKHIPICLYLQRMHAGNTQRDLDRNAQIQAETVVIHGAHIEPMCLAWAKRSGLAALDLGGAHGSPRGYAVVDLAPRPEGHMAYWYQGDAIEVLESLPAESVGVIRASDFLEHVPDKVRLMNAIHRALAHGGMLLSQTPSTDGRGAFQDPTHVAFWNENSFWYYTDQQLQKYVPEITARFQVSHLESHFPSQWHRDYNIPYVRADLVALHDGPRQGGWLKWRR